jgi:HEAT repeat protein
LKVIFMPKSDIPIETLIEQLHGEDWMARCDAARLLGQSRDPRAADALMPDLNDSDWRVRRNAAQALGTLRDKRAVEPLIQALKDRTMTVRQRAIVALGRIKEPQSLPALLHIFLEHRHESYDANKAILKFGKKAIPELAKAFEKNNDQELMLLLIKMKYEGAFELILKLLQSPQPPTRITAIQELGKLGDKKAIPHLIDQLNNDDPMLQSEAVRALGKLGAVETAPVLLSLLTDDELYGPRSNIYHAVTEAFQSFGGITVEIKNAFPGNYPAIFNMGGTPISLPEAMGFLENHPSDMLKEVLSRLQGGQAEPIESLGLPADTINQVFENMQWKFGVMFADARDAKKDRVTRLLELLGSESPLTRSAAALTLPWYGDERSIEPLSQLKRDQDETVCAATTWAFNTVQKSIEYRKQLGL